MYIYIYGICKVTVKRSARARVHSHTRSKHTEIHKPYL